MISRRLLGKGLFAMTISGSGGTPPVPAGYVPPSLPGQAAGSPSGTVRARQVIISGAGGLLLVYSPSVGFGNLIYSVAGASGTDGPPGNAILQGAVSYKNAGGGVYWAEQTLGVTVTWFVSVSGAGGPYAQFADIGFGFATPNLGTLLIQANNQVSIGQSGGMVWNDTGAAAPSQLTLPAGGGPFVLSETWHNITLAGNFTGTFRVMKLPWNRVAVNGALTWSGTGPTTATFGTLPDSTYLPVTDVRHPVAHTGIPTSLQSGPRVFVPAAGTGLQLIMPQVTTANTSIGFDFDYPTN